MKWEVVGGGALRFRGEGAVRQILDLIENDDDYTWSIPGGWPAPLWIDVYPRTPEAQKLLLELVASPCDRCQGTGKRVLWKPGHDPEETPCPDCEVTNGHGV